MINTDLIIVGQGLAGSVLALKLIESGFNIVVIDKQELSSCSKVAAGIWNPVVFKRLTRSWKADELLPEMMNFYRSAEKILAEKLITERQIIKLFSEQQEADLWIKKANGELEGFLDKNIYTEPFQGIQTTAIGYSKVLHSGNLDLKAFLSGLRNYLLKKNNLFQEAFDHAELIVSEQIKYKNISAKGIIFAEGHLIKNNPFFNYIPMKPAKGEVLMIKNYGLKEERDIINKNGFILPLHDHIYKSGATYNWSELNDEPTPEGLSELQGKLNRIISDPYEVVGHSAGVRPSVIDRRPVLGNHPKHKNVYLFNGMGTKGVMLAPYFAGKLADHLKYGALLEEETDLRRFNRFFVN